MFVGRVYELERLERYLDQVRSTGSGAFVAVRGRHQVGKSTLVEEFTRRAGVPALFFAASKGAPPDRELDELVRIAEASGPAFASAFRSVAPRDWSGALRLLADAIVEPSVVVLDELPWLAAGDPHLEGALQTAWDRHLSRVPVLLVALGSDLSMMERLGEYGPAHAGDGARAPDGRGDLRHSVPRSRRVLRRPARRGWVPPAYSGTGGPVSTR